jgi:hypothetical protein
MRKHITQQQVSIATYYPLPSSAIYSDVKGRMAGERCVRQTTTIQPQIAGMATTNDQADISSKSDSIGFSHQSSMM